jgi:23S rRNA pseudouridine2604 synthase
MFINFNQKTTHFFLFNNKLRLARKRKLLLIIVKKLLISNKTAQELLETNSIKVNGRVVNSNIEIGENDQVMLNDTTEIKSAKKPVYMALNKPRGTECTLNTSIANNLTELLKCDEKLFPVGRLDKESEGLLILTNDGKFFNKIINPENKVEKEYIVTVDKEITGDFVTNMSKGVSILGKITAPCFVEKTMENEFKIILTQGMNRQIRRMCYKQGYMVQSLKRVRIGNVFLGELKTGESREIFLAELSL